MMFDKNYLFFLMYLAQLGASNEIECRKIFFKPFTDGYNFETNVYIVLDDYQMDTVPPLIDAMNEGLPKPCFILQHDSRVLTIFDFALVRDACFILPKTSTGTFSYKYDNSWMTYTNYNLAGTTVEYLEWKGCKWTVDDSGAGIPDKTPYCVPLGNIAFTSREEMIHVDELKRRGIVVDRTNYRQTRRQQRQRSRAANRVVGQPPCMAAAPGSANTGVKKVSPHFRKTYTGLPSMKFLKPVGAVGHGLSPLSSTLLPKTPVPPPAPTAAPSAHPSGPPPSGPPPAPTAHRHRSSGGVPAPPPSGPPPAQTAAVPARSSGPPPPPSGPPPAPTAHRPERRVPPPPPQNGAPGGPPPPPPAALINKKKAPSKASKEAAFQNELAEILRRRRNEI